MAEFTYNRGPITSVEWSPLESSILAASSADQTLCIWDLSVERAPGPAKPYNTLEALEALEAWKIHGWS